MEFTAENIVNDQKLYCYIEWMNFNEKIFNTEYSFGYINIELLFIG